MNLPNKLTVLRVLLVPVFIIVMSLGGVLPFPWCNILAAAVFLGTALTDMLDGKIARKRNLITDFGKIMDPVADKFMVFSALIVLISHEEFAYMQIPLLWVTLIVIFRELVVTSIRMVVSEKAKGASLAANWLGKVKTVSQITFIMTALLEPVLFGWFLTFISEYHILTFATGAFMTVMTIWSGVNYIVGYSKYLTLK